MSRHGNRTIRTLARSALLLASAAAALAGASTAAASTWTINPTTINETDQPISRQQIAIDDGNWLTEPLLSLPGGTTPGDNGNQDTYGFDAPKLDEGADAVVTYAMPDATEFQAFTLDDVDGGGSADMAAPMCIDPDPSGPQPGYSCAATFGGQPGTWPWDPSNENFTSAFHNFRDNSAEAPAGYPAASVIAVGQTCGAELSPGQTWTCTVGHPTMNGFSPVDPNNYMLLQFINRGNEPTTITDTDNWALQMLQQYPGGGLFSSTTADTYDSPPATSCTMSTWAATCGLGTFGGANSNAAFDTSTGGGPFQGQRILQVGNPNSDTITITPGPGAPPGPEWYGARVEVEGEIGHSVQDGQSMVALLQGVLAEYFETFDDPLGGETADTTLRSGTALAPDHQLSNGLYRLTMRKDGNLVQDVRVNRLNVPVWQSGTHVPGSRLVLDRRGRLAVISRDGTRQWTAFTSDRGAGAGARMQLHADGRIVVSTHSGKVRYATRRVAYPVPADPRAITLQHGLALQPGAQLRNGTSRLRMLPDGNLALYRDGKLRWSTHTEGHPGSYAHLRDEDGRLIVSTAQGTVLWTAGARGRRLTLRKNGALVLRNRAGHIVWTAPTPNGNSSHQWLRSRSRGRARSAVGARRGAPVQRVPG